MGWGIVVAAAAAAAGGGASEKGVRRWVGESKRALTCWELIMGDAVVGEKIRVRAGRI